MPWTIYDYRDDAGRNVIKAWLSKAGHELRAKADAKIVMLRQFGPDCPPNLLSGTKERHIDKLRLLGKNNTRILCCRGPVDAQTEYTLLAAHPEKDSKLPKGAEAKAEIARQSVRADPSNRREPHDFKS